MRVCAVCCRLYSVHKLCEAVRTRFTHTIRIEYDCGWQGSKKRRGEKKWHLILKHRKIMNKRSHLFFAASLVAVVIVIIVENFIFNVIEL